MEAGVNDFRSYKEIEKNKLLQQLLKITREWYRKTGNYKKRCEMLD